MLGLVWIFFPPPRIILNHSTDTFGLAQQKAPYVFTFQNYCQTWKGTDVEQPLPCEFDLQHRHLILITLRFLLIMHQIPLQLLFSHTCLFMSELILFGNYTVLQIPFMIRKNICFTFASQFTVCFG